MFEIGTIFAIKTKHQFGENYRFIKVTRATRGRTYASPLRYNPYEKLSTTQFKVTPSDVIADIEYRINKDSAGYYIGNDGRMKKSYIAERFNQTKDYINTWN